MKSPCLECLFYNRAVDGGFGGCALVESEKESRKKRPHVCMAFEDGIPNEIWSGKVPHDEEHSYGTLLVFTTRD